MSNWHKCPNALVDRLMGNVLSPNATCVVLTIWRLTEGVRERHQASIPTETFMRVTGTNRKKTAYQYVNEAINSGLVAVKKEQGKVNIYSINKGCSLWYEDEVVAESAPSAESATGGDNCHLVGAESATGLAETRGGKCHTYKDIEIKDNIKDKKKAPAKPKFDALTYPIPSFIEQENWDDFVEMRKKIKKPLTEVSSKRTVNALIKFDANGFDANNSLDYSITNDYAGVFERSRKQTQLTNQVNGNANTQPKQSRYDNHKQSLQQQLQQQFAAEDAQQGVGSFDCRDVYEMDN